MKARPLACLTGSAIALVSYGALAQEVTSETPDHLLWVVETSAENCPSEMDLRQKLVERLGADPFVAPTTPDFEVRLRKAHGRYLAEIRKSAAGSDELRSIGGDAKTCGEVVEAVALAFSVLLEANADVHAADQPKPATPLPRLVSDSCPILPPPEEPKAPPPPRVSKAAWLGMGLVVALRDLPATGMGPMLTAGFELSRPWEFTAGATYLGTERARRSGAVFAFSLTEAWVGLGGSFPLASRFQFQAHMAPVAGWIHAYPENQTPLDAGESAYLGVRLGVHLAYRLAGPLGVLAGLSGQARASRWKFSLRDEESRVVWSQRRLGGRAELLLVWRTE